MISQMGYVELYMPTGLQGRTAGWVYSPDLGFDRLPDLANRMPTPPRTIAAA